MLNHLYHRKSTHKCTHVDQNREGECKSMINLIMVRKDMLVGVHDVKEMFSLSTGLLDNMIVLCNVECETGGSLSEKVCGRQWKGGNKK